MKNYSSLAQVKSDINAGVVNCQQLVAYYLENIENKKHLNAFVEVYAEEARAHAIEVDAKIKAGTAGIYRYRSSTLVGRRCHCNRKTKL